MAAEENRMAHFRRLVEENSLPGKDGLPDLSSGYRKVADVADLTYDYVYQLYAGKSNKKTIGAKSLKKISEAFADGRPADWMDQPLAQEPGDESFDSIRPPTIAEAVHVLAEALMNMDPIGRGMAETVLASLAKDPSRPETTLEMLQLLIRSHTEHPAPEPTPPSGSRAREKQRAEEGLPGKARLVLKIGGGEKRQLALPLKTVRNPFDPDAAPASERAWYDRLRGLPKRA